MAAKAISVLVLEDDDDVRSMVVEALASAGYDVTAVATAAGAERVLTLAHFAAAVLDIFLPDGRGLAFLELLRDHDPQVVAIVMTGFASLDTALMALRLGAYEYLCKPFTPDLLLRSLSRGLERRQLILYNLEMAQDMSLLAQQLQAQRTALQDRMSQATSTLAAVTELPDLLAATPGPAAALVVVCQTAARLASADLVAALFPRQDAFEVAALHDLTARVSPTADLPRSPLLDAALASSAPAYATDLFFGEPLADDHLLGLGFASAVALPVLLQSRALGLLLCASRRPDAFGGEKPSLLGLVASQATAPFANWLARPDGPDATGFVDIQSLL